MIEAIDHGNPAILSEELGDVLFVLLCMANEQGIDIEEAFELVMAKYHERDSQRWDLKL